MVDSDPECPVFSAWSKSKASLPRTSPTMILSGRSLKLIFTRSRIVTAGSPGLSPRASSRTRSGFSNLISAVSSMRTILSSSEIELARAFSNVVFPVPVPPLIRSVLRSATAVVNKLCNFSR